MRLKCMASDCTSWDSGTGEVLVTKGWWQWGGERGLCPVHSREHEKKMGKMPKRSRAVILKVSK